MPYLITATDFSDVADNAVQYACGLARELNMPLSIVHSYTVPVAFHENPMPVIPMEESKQAAEEQMADLVKKLKAEYNDVEIKQHVYYGDVTDCLQELVEQNKPWAVVVGNSVGEENGFWLGGNLMSLLKNVHCPVIAVPEHYNYRKPHNICLACDYKNIKATLPADTITKLVSLSNASFHVLNVDHDNSGFDANTPFESTELHELLRTIKPQYHYVESEDIDDGIQDFVEKEKMDWLLVIPHKHSFFESLFHKSQTKQIVKNAKVPIVALHDKPKA